MASATRTSQQNSTVPGVGEDEPLLGRAGDASQQEGKPLYYNLIIGTAVVAQAGIWILAAIVWGSVFSSDLMLFSAHPLANSAAILFFTQAILILQPTHTKEQKKQGTWVHSSLNAVGLAAGVAGLVVIEYNKIAHKGAHFVSPHAILGLITYVCLVLQAAIGFAQYFLPQIFGGENSAKKLYKYHRASGYLIILLALATVAAATQTDFNRNVLHIQLWAVLVASVITLVGVLPRIKKQKITKTNSGRDHLKALRYEDTTTAKAPIQTRTGSPTSPSSSTTPPSTEDASERSRIISDIQRLPFKVRYHPPVEVKRDSGIAPSTSTTGIEFNAEGTSNSGGISKVSNVPAVVIQDESLPVRTDVSHTPFSRRRMREARVPDAPASSLQRSGSFKGITTSIPTGDFGDFTSPDRLEFSNRGSMLFGGKKMNDTIGNQPNGLVGLVSGRRKPSVHMTQHVPQEPRALSADAIVFSEKVRSMYEHGDEKAAEWTRQQGAPATHALKNLRQDDSPLPQGDCQTLKVDKTRDRAVDQASNAFAANRRESGIKKQPFETAGGIEDWEDVDGQEVDRYGFIILKKQLSRGASPEPQAIQRVSTALKLASESPRQKRTLHRGPSSAKSSRSAAPSRASSALSVRPPGSCSGQDDKSGGLSSNPFRFRDRRLMDEASDMLTLPPGFSDIAEEDESGRAVTSMKEREFNREEKWRKMARVTAQTTVKGGGMTFSFDTRDPKVISRTWKGIPDRWRASAWHSFLSSSAKARGAH
ncbi:hypothetical protein B0A49_12111, partial [Cryomyces minteri]